MRIAGGGPLGKLSLALHAIPPTDLTSLPFLPTTKPLSSQPPNLFMLFALYAVCLTVDSPQLSQNIQSRHTVQSMSF